MIVLPVPMLRSVGYGGVLVPLVSVAVAAPCSRSSWPASARGWTGRGCAPSARQPGVRRLGPPGTGTAGVAALAVGIMAALMLPALSLHLGEPGSRPGQQRARTRRADHADRGRLPSGVITPAEVLTSADPGRVAAEAARVPGVSAPWRPAPRITTGTARPS